MEPVLFSVTPVPADAVAVLEEALAVGGTCIVTVTLSVPVLPWLLVTVNWNTRSVCAATVGAVNDAVAVLAPVKLTVVPAICAHK